MSEYDQWENAVVQAVADNLGFSHSDASSVVETQPFYMQQSWGKGMDAQQTATKILVEAQR